MNEAIGTPGMLPQSFLKKWETHIAFLVSTVLVALILSFEFVSATEYAALNRLIDFIARYNNIFSGAVAGYWLSRWMLKREYKMVDSMTISFDALLSFQKTRALYICTGVLAFCLPVKVI